MVAVALGVYFASASPVFLTQPNLVNIAQATAPAAIVAAGMVLLLVSGEIDLSVAAVYALAPFLMHYAIDFYGVPILLAIVLALAISALIGFINGFITVVFKVPSFVTTLGTVLHRHRHRADDLARLPGADPRGGHRDDPELVRRLRLGPHHLVPADRGASSTSC